MKKSSTRLRIGFLLKQYPNPVQSYINCQIAEFIRHGHQVRIYSDIKLANMPLSDDLQFIKQHIKAKFNFSYNHSMVLIRAMVSMLFPFTLLRTRLIIRFYQLTRKYGFKYLVKSLSLAFNSRLGSNDIFHAHSLFTAYDFLAIAELLSTPMVITFHGKTPDGIQELSKEKMQLLYDSLCLFTVNSSYSRRQLEESGCPPEKIQIIPQGLEIAKYHFIKRQINKSEKLQLLSVSRLSREKDIETAIKAVKELSKIYPNIQYNIAGDGPEFNKLNNLCSDLKLDNIVFFHGFVSGEKLTEFFNCSHILILPSLLETQGLVMQEAQAYGLPVVASAAGGIPDFIADKNTGLLFKTSSQTDLKNKLELLIENNDLYNSICIKGRKYVETNINISSTCLELEKIYTRISIQ